ncbi:MAG: hypothetical protein RMK43_12755 [Cyclobacteriaceae bacterium]|nr:hypothetical protein [Cyclobacteriaceae bacterium]
MSLRKVQIFESDRTAQHLVQMVQAWVSAANPIRVISASYRQHHLQRNSYRHRLVIIYERGVMPSLLGNGRPTRALLFRSPSLSQVLADISSFLALGSSTFNIAAPRLQAIVDLTAQENATPSQRQFLVFVDDFGVNRNFGDAQQVFIGYTQYGAIAEESFGNIDVYDSFGSPCALNVPVYNVSLRTWPASHTSYILLCPITARLLGISFCQTGVTPPSSNFVQAYRAFRYPLLPGYSGDLRHLEVPYRGLPLSTEP